MLSEVGLSLGMWSCENVVCVLGNLVLSKYLLAVIKLWSDGLASQQFSLCPPPPRLHRKLAMHVSNCMGKNHTLCSILHQQKCDFCLKIHAIIQEPLKSRANAYTIAMKQLDHKMGKFP